MRAPAIVARVLPKIEEVLDVVVPRLQVRARRATALAAPIDRHGHVVCDLQEGDDPLALDPGRVDRGAGRPDVRPIVPDPAGPLREHRVVGVTLEDLRQVVIDSGEIARRKLRPRGAGVEERRRARHVTALREELVEFDRPIVALRRRLIDAKAHRDAHPERLRQLDRRIVDAQEVALVERLHAKVLDLGVTLRTKCARQAIEVEVEQARVQPAALDAEAQLFTERAPIGRVALGAGRRAADHQFEEPLLQEARGDEAVRRIPLDEGGRGQDHRLLDPAGRDPVIDIVDRLADQQIHIHVIRELGGPAAERILDHADVEEHGPAVALHHGQAAQLGVLDGLLARGLADL